MGELFAGRYELLEPVAEGGMGSVWAVRDHRVGEVRAAKLLRQSDAGSVLRFVREQSMRIDHAHVLAPRTWAAEDDRVLFTMPLVRGGSVADLVGDMGPLPASWVVELLDQLLQGLEAVHAAGIVHRDVKPANLLLEPTGTDPPHLLLSDFGAAVPVDEPRMTRASLVFATPGYTAQEQLRGHDPHPSQDLYSVGMVGLELVSGTRPPGAEPAAAQRVGAEPELGPLVALLADAASADPSRRPPDAAAFRRRLHALGVPAVSADDGVSVFTHLDPSGRPVETAAETAADVAEPRPVPATTRRTPRRGGTSDRAIGLLLLGVAAVCVLLALWLVLG